MGDARLGPETSCSLHQRIVHPIVNRVYTAAQLNRLRRIQSQFSAVFHFGGAQRIARAIRIRRCQRQQIPRCVIRVVQRPGNAPLKPTPGLNGPPAWSQPFLTMTTAEVIVLSPPPGS